MEEKIRIRLEKGSGQASEVAYDRFIKNGLAIGFTDDQIDFLWDWINEIARNKALAGGMF